MASSIPKFSRVARIEYTHPVVYLPVLYVISILNILSCAKPFDTWVNNIKKLKLRNKIVRLAYRLQCGQKNQLSILICVM